MNKINLLVLIRNFDRQFPKHKFKMDLIRAIGQQCDMRCWFNNGNIFEIIKALHFKPDFIFHYDIGWNFSYAPNISGLNEIDIPVGCYVNDIHNPLVERIFYFHTVNPDLIFTTYKRPFLQYFPQYKDKQRWLPFSVNPYVFKDYKQEKQITYLLMGLVFDYENKNDFQERAMWIGRYPFREKVLKSMINVQGFKYHRHPGHFSRDQNKAIVNERYAHEINRSKIFFTCGGVNQYAVAKFFEVPACRTLLMAYPNDDIFELGFVSEKNYVACDFNDFFEKAEFYSKNDSLRERITNEGYDFIHKNHTNDIRAKQFLNYIIDYLGIKHLNN